MDSLYFNPGFAEEGEEVLNAHTFRGALFAVWRLRLAKLQHLSQI